MRRKRNRISSARQLLAPVYSWFIEGFDTPDLKEAKGPTRRVGFITMLLASVAHQGRGAWWRISPSCRVCCAVLRRPPRRATRTKATNQAVLLEADGFFL